MGKRDVPLLQCSFCGKSQDQVRKLIAGPGIYICDECINLCNEILREEGVTHHDHAQHQHADANKSKDSAEKLPTPKEIKAHLDEYVIGNTDAKKTLAVAVYNHYKRIKHNYISAPEQAESSEGLVQASTPARSRGNKDDVVIQKSNILLLGPTGSGKTHVVETLAKLLKVPFVIADATTITEAGYVGDDAENILQRLMQNAGGDIEKAQQGIIYVDEIDKISRKSENASITRDVSGEGVQQALLKLIEGTIASIPPQGGRKHPHAEMIQVDTSNILFICGGAFVGLEQLIEKRRQKSKSSIGFGSEALTDDEKQKRLTEAFKHVEPEDLVHFGLIPEFVGRMPVITSMDAPDLETLRQILTKPRNSVTKQYQKLLEIDGAVLSFEQGAIEAIAKKAQKRKMGARALRSIVESVMKDIMYEVPSRDDVTEIVITEAMINDVKLAKVIPIDQAKKTA